MTSSRFGQDLLDRIIAATDVAAIIGKYTSLRANGKRLTGLCPFHKEKTPSFSVDPINGLYYCFGCHAGGSIFQFLMEKEGISFAEAVESLAKDAGITIPRFTGSIGRSDALYNAADFAARFFKKNLDSEAGAGARQYLISRGIPQKLWNSFLLGWASPDQLDLPANIVRSNLSFEPFVKIGIIGKTKTDNKYFSTISDALVIPIANQSAKIVGFAHRMIKEDPRISGPKYVNSPESDIYHKSTILFGLPQARSAIKSSEISILVEGYFDAMALVNAGIENVVATCGTALTSTQATIIFKYAPKIIVFYDGDEAGLKATIRAIDILLYAGLEVYIARPPEGEDPDSFARKNGAVDTLELLEHRENWFDWLYEHISVKHRKTKTLQTVDIIEAMSGPFAALTDMVSFEIHIRELSKRLGIAEPTLRERLKKSAQKHRTPGFDVNEPTNGFALNNEERLELSLITVISKHGIIPEHPGNPLVFFPGLWVDAVGGKCPAELIANVDDERVRSCIAEFAILPDPPDILAHIESLLRKVLKKYFDSEKGKLEAELKEVEKKREGEKIQKITSKILKISNEMCSLGKMKLKFITGVQK